jgi:hypothetical protein
MGVLIINKNIQAVLIDMKSQDLRNLREITNGILSESTQGEESFMNSWPYTAPYLTEESDLVEGPVGEFADGVARTAGRVVGGAERAIQTGPAYLKQKVKNVKSTFDNARERTRDNIPPNVVRPQRKSPRPDFMGRTPRPGFPVGRTDKWDTKRGGQVQHMGRDLNNSVDLFDLLSDFLVSEGYSEQETLEMMVIMTEEQRNIIVENILQKGIGMVKGAAKSGLLRTVGLAAASKDKVKNFVNPPRSKSADPVVRAGGSYTGLGGAATYN